MIETYDLTNPDKPTINKDPGATLDYAENWGAWLALAGDALASATVVAEEPLVVLGAPTLINGVVTAIITGGTPGKLHRVTFSIITVGPPVRIDQRSIYLRVRER